MQTYAEEKWHITWFNIIGILLLVSYVYFCVHIGLTLRSEDISAAAEAWPVGIFGLV